MKVREMMTKNVITCASEDPCGTVAKKMIEQDLGLLIVVEDNLTKRPIGVISDRDIISRILLKKADPNQVTAGEIATKKLISIKESSTVGEAATMMRKCKVKRLVVIDDTGMLVGILSQSDFIKEFLAIKDQLVDLAVGM